MTRQSKSGHLTTGQGLTSSDPGHDNAGSQGVCEETSRTLPSRNRLIIAMTNDLAGNGLSGMNSNAAWSGFDSRTLLTLVRTTGSLSSL
jgi:hypothetical protein